MSDEHNKAITVIERSTDRSMSPVVVAGLKILEQNPSPETLRELLKVQQEWEANEARKEYAAAMVNLKADLPSVLAHDKHVKFNTTEYTHTSLGAAVGAVLPHLINYGFAHSWHPSTVNPNEIAVACRLTHRNGHYQEVELRAPPDPKGGKNGPQAVASTVTMLERYTLLALLGIATADMEEPTGAEDDAPNMGKVDTERNLAAVGKLKKKGRTVEEAIAFLGGRTVEHWTVADLKKLEAWVKPPASGEAT